MFPIRRCILLPRVHIALNVFEPRYLAMIDDVLASGRVLGIVQPATLKSRDEGKELAGNEEESPLDPGWPLRETGCLGRLTAFNEDDKGRMSIVLTGICRFQTGPDIEESGRPYRICRLDYKPFGHDLDEAPAGLVDRNRLLSLLRIYLKHRGMDADWRIINHSSTEALVNMLCIHAPWGEEEKQALLEASSLAERASILVALAEMELAGEGGSRAGGGGGVLQ